MAQAVAQGYGLGHPRRDRKYAMGRSFRRWLGRVNPFHWTRQHRLAWLIVSLAGAVAGVLFAFIRSPFFFDPRGWSSFGVWLLSPGAYWKWAPGGFLVTAGLFYLVQLFRESN
jgi:hypothetical protein